MSRISASGDPDDIFMWHRLDPKLTTSGKLVEHQLASLDAVHVSHIVNLAPDSHDEALTDEAGLLGKMGIGYTYIPVSFEAPAEADFERFARAMEDLGGQTIHVHCIANLRVSAFLYRYRTGQLGWTTNDARADMDRIWRPGGAWAAFIGDEARTAADHAFAGRDY